MARDSRRTCVPRSQVISGRSVTVTNRRQKVRWLATGFPATDLVRLSECHGDGEVVGASVLIDRFAHSANWRSAGPRGAHTASRIQDHEQAGSEYLNLFEDHASPYLIIQYTAAPPLRIDRLVYPRRLPGSLHLHDQAPWPEARRVALGGMPCVEWCSGSASVWKGFQVRALPRSGWAADGMLLFASAACAVAIRHRASSSKCADVLILRAPLLVAVTPR